MTPGSGPIKSFIVSVQSEEEISLDIRDKRDILMELDSIISTCSDWSIPVITASDWSQSTSDLFVDN